MIWARVMADTIVVLHVAWVGFVVLGLAAIVVGLAAGWGWVRNFWFRVIHLGMIGVVVAEALAGVTCPLTGWEKQLRHLGGQEGYAGDFIGHWAHRLIFFHADPWVFTAGYVLFGAVVLATFLIAPPRHPRRARASANAAVGAMPGPRSGT